jgi:hypothetical protein
MTRVRMGNFVLIPDGEYDLIQLDERGHWVVRDWYGDVLTEEQDSPSQVVEIRCDYCDAWVDHAGPAALGWRCNGGLGPCEEQDAPG